MGISIKNLSKAFGENTVLSNLNAELPTSGLARIVGSSGSGKTTLLRIIAGLDTDYTGSIEGVGTISFMFQEHRLFPWLNALDNVTVASFEDNSEENRASAAKMLRILGFSDDSMRLKPSQLSGGMKQRVSLARALLRKSDVLILDEPSKELDRELVAVVASLIKEHAAGRLVLLVSHDSELDGLIADCEITVQ